MRVFTQQKNPAWLLLVALVQAIILTPAACLAEGWTDERTVGPLACHADFSLNDHAATLREVADLQQELVRVLGIGPAKVPVQLYLFKDKRSYQDYLKRYFPKVPQRRALFVQRGGRPMVFVYKSREMAVDLRHETTHALLHASLPMVPLWLDEGLAEYFEVPRNRRAFGNPHLGPVRWSVRLGMAPKLPPLEKKNDLRKMGGADYRGSWAWVHFMLHGPVQAHQELVSMLSDIQAQTPPGKLSDRLERRLPGTRDRLKLHFQNWKR